MARGRRAAATTNTAATTEQAPANTSPSVDDFAAEAGLLALQKHVDASSDIDNAADPTGAADAVLPSAGEEQQDQKPDLTAPTSQALPPGQLYALSATHLFTRQNDAALALAAVSASGLAEADSEAQIHPDLRSMQAAAQFGGSSTAPAPSSYPPPPDSSALMATAQPATPQQQPRLDGLPNYTSPLASASSMNETPNTRPAAPAAVAPTPEQQAPTPPVDGRKGPRRELSQSKRAAQNRAAQRAFRQRKEGYIKKLEEQVKNYGEMESHFKALQSENYALREYVIHLQSKLLDAKADLPQPPPHLNLSVPGSTLLASGNIGAGPAATAAASTAAANLLANAAAAAAAAQQQQQQQQQQKQTPVPVPQVPATVDTKNPLARVAEAVAELGQRNKENSAAAAAAAAGAVDAGAGSNGDGAGAGAGAGEPMDTSADEIDRQLAAATANGTAVASM